MGKERKKPQRALLAEARTHLEELEAAGLPAGALERYENALRGMAMQAREAAPTTQVLVRDIQREVEEFQAAIRKEFPGNASFQQAFKAQDPMPKGAREALALGRHVAREATGFAQNLIKYALNAATVKHLGALCDQLESELGGADPAQDLRAIEDEILSAARKAFSGRPELSAFTRSES